MSVLTLNSIGYLAGLGSNSIGYRTGQPWLVPAGVEKVIVASGRKVPAGPGTLFTDVDQQGIYELVGPGQTKTTRAVNLADLTVSNLANTPALKIESGGGTSVEPVMEKSSFSEYILIAILVLASLEALIVYRRRRRLAEA
jgi:hypothetical protein